MDDYDRLWRNSERSFKLFQRFVVGVMIVGFLAAAGWSALVYQDCRANGLRLYQCAAMMQNPHYVAVDNLDRP